MFFFDCKISLIFVIWDVWCIYDGYCKTKHDPLFLVLQWTYQPVYNAVRVPRVTPYYRKRWWTTKSHWHYWYISSISDTKNLQSKKNILIYHTWNAKGYVVRLLESIWVSKSVFDYLFQFLWSRIYKKKELSFNLEKWS